MYITQRGFANHESVILFGTVTKNRDKPVITEAKVGKSPSISFTVITDTLRMTDNNGNVSTKHNFVNCTMYYYPPTAAIYEMIKGLKRGQPLIVLGHVFDQRLDATDGAPVVAPRVFVQGVLDPNTLAMIQLGIDKDTWSPPRTTEMQVEIQPNQIEDEYDFN